MFLLLMIGSTCVKVVVSVIIILIWLKIVVRRQGEKTMNRFNRCWTPTSLWKAFETLGSGEYTILVDKDNIKVTKR